MMARFKIFITCLCLALGARAFGVETNSVSSTPPDFSTQNMMNSFLQIQAQLHDAQMALENNRREAKQQAEAMAAKIQSLEEIIATQRAEELQTAQRNQQFTLALAGAFGLTVLAAVLFMAYLQWRAVSRLVEMTVQRVAYPGMPAASLGSATVQDSSVRLAGAVDGLQKRILEMEQAARGALAEKNAGNGNSHGLKNGDAAANDREECIANLVTEGQTLLDAHEPEKALECFEVALGLDPKHVDTLLKKGGALEKMGRTDEAITCYDQAIELNGSSTVAYLQKGGLFNRLARYDEALQCYEKALRTQDKKEAA